VNPDLRSSAEGIRDSILLDGFAVVANVLAPAEIDALQHVLGRLADLLPATKRGATYAIRDLLDASPEVRALAEITRVRDLIEPILGESCFPVRGIYSTRFPPPTGRCLFTRTLRSPFERKSRPKGLAHGQSNPVYSIRSRPSACSSRCSPCGFTLTIAMIGMAPCVSSLDHIDKAASPSPRLKLFADNEARSYAAFRPEGHRSCDRSCCTPRLRRKSHNIDVIHVDFAAHPLPGPLRWR
jgi:hypothetical protein